MGHRLRYSGCDNELTLFQRRKLRLPRLWANTQPEGTLPRFEARPACPNQHSRGASAFRWARSRTGSRVVAARRDRRACCSPSSTSGRRSSRKSWAADRAARRVNTRRRLPSLQAYGVHLLLNPLQRHGGKLRGGQLVRCLEEIPRGTPAERVPNHGLDRPGRKQPLGPRFLRQLVWQFDRERCHSRPSPDAGHFTLVAAFTWPDRGGMLATRTSAHHRRVRPDGRPSGPALGRADWRSSRDRRAVRDRGRGRSGCRWR